MLNGRVTQDLQQLREGLEEAGLHLESRTSKPLEWKALPRVMPRVGKPPTVLAKGRDSIVLLSVAATCWPPARLRSARSALSVLS